jgi:hypothetical protein
MVAALFVTNAALSLLQVVAATRRRVPVVRWVPRFREHGPDF